MKKAKKTSQLDWFKEEIRSVLTTTAAFVVVDGIGQITALYNGDFSKDVFFGLLLIFVRSLVKALINQILPQVKKKIEEEKLESNSSIEEG